MSIKNTNLTAIIIAAIVGSGLTVLAYSLFNISLDSSAPGEQDMAEKSEKSEKMVEKKPLYWVAPMDANYRRDKPGKSPMGMDLVPVYDTAGDSGSAIDEGPGTIKISPQVVNNLGVRFATAEKRKLFSEIKTVGYVTYDEDQLIHIHPRVEGWIEKLYIKAAGDPVKQGQPLYDIYSPALVNAQEELLLALDRKNQRLIQAAEDRLKALQLPDIAIKNLIQTKKVKQTITFYAPQSGVVDNLNIREGFFAKPGTTLMSIGKLDQIWVEAEVFERQASLVAVGMPVSMTLAYLPGKQWNGQVDYVYPTLDPKNRTIKVRLRFENKDQLLKPNMYAQVVLHGVSDPLSLMIPKEAVIRTGDSDRVVLALGDGRFKSVEVKVGHYEIDFVEILSGLKEGERVVSSAQFLLDSESSKTSDFKRMSDVSSTEAKNSMDSEATVESATVKGVINSVMRDHRMLNISRDAIKKWGRGPATLDFMVSEDVDMSKLEQGSSILFTFHLADGQFVITEINLTSHQSMPGENP